jgi:molybdenum cofactor biosynthesis enzyme MoaA
MKKENQYSNDSFCPEVYNQIQIDSQGDIRICCLSSDGGLTKDSSGNVMNVKTHSIIDAMNSEIHKQHRLELSNNIKPARCSNCYVWEKHGESRRNKFINLSNTVLPDYAKSDTAYDLTFEDGSIDVQKTKLVNLDIRFGNLCNLQCIMCDPANSSLWYEDWDMLSRLSDSYDSSGRIPFLDRGGIDPVSGKSQFWKDKATFFLLERNKHGKLKIEGESESSWWESDSWKEQFKSIAPQLRHIYFTGGEPLIVPAMEEHLTYLIEHDLAKNIILCYDTNLTVVNKKIIDKWIFFKKVTLRVSVDEVGDRYNLVRNPGNFDKLIDNIKLVKSAGIPIQQLSMVCSIVNIYGVTRLAKMAKDLGLPLSLRFVNKPSWLNINILPKSARQEVIDYLTNFLQSTDCQTISGYEHVVKAQIKHLTNTIHSTSEIQHEMLTKFVRNMNALDSSRNLNWKTTLPDVVSLFQKHCPEINLGV